MLLADRKYLWQLIEAATGRRCEPFIATPMEFKNILAGDALDDNDAHYVLCLADLSLEIKPQDFVSRFPIYRASTFLEMDIDKLMKPVYVDDDLVGFETTEEKING